MLNIIKILLWHMPPLTFNPLIKCHAAVILRSTPPTPPRWSWYQRAKWTTAAGTSSMLIAPPDTKCSKSESMCLVSWFRHFFLHDHELKLRRKSTEVSVHTQTCLDLPETWRWATWREEPADSPGNLQRATEEREWRATSLRRRPWREKPGPRYDSTPVCSLQLS